MLIFFSLEKQHIKKMAFVAKNPAMISPWRNTSTNNIRMSCVDTLKSSFQEASRQQLQRFFYSVKLTEKLFTTAYLSSFSFILLHWFLGNFAGMFCCSSVNKTTIKWINFFQKFVFFLWFYPSRNWVKQCLIN